MQTNYSYSTPIGAAGGIVDLAPHYIRSFTNEANTGAILFGMGVTTGTNAGFGVKLPESTDTAGLFEGIVTNRRTTELDLEGNFTLRNKCALGVMQYGVIYALIGEDNVIAYGDPVYLIVSGDDAGKFTNASTGSADYVAVKGRFLGAESDGIAIVELFNQAQS